MDRRRFLRRGITLGAALAAGQGEWTGVPLSLLLREAGVQSRATWIVAEGADASGNERRLPSPTTGSSTWSIGSRSIRSLGPDAVVSPLAAGAPPRRRPPARSVSTAA